MILINDIGIDLELRVQNLNLRNGILELVASNPQRLISNSLNLLIDLLFGLLEGNGGGFPIIDLVLQVGNRTLELLDLKIVVFDLPFCRGLGGLCVIPLLGQFFHKLLRVKEGISGRLQSVLRFLQLPLFLVPLLPQLCKMFIAAF